MNPGTFQEMVQRLNRYYGDPASNVLADAFQIILHENIAYLADDDRRERAFSALADKIGLQPEAIVQSSKETLIAIASLGGIHAEERANRIRLAAEMILEDFGGDLNTVLSLPTPQAKKMLRRFPAIGEPGAEKILLFTETAPILSLESNGLRVLIRLGFGDVQTNYSATYHSAQNAVADELPTDCRWLIKAHQLLRRHGKELCRSKEPACGVCPVNDSCDFYASTRHEGNREV